MKGLFFGCRSEALSRVPGGHGEAALVARGDASDPISEAIFGFLREAAEVGPRWCEAPEGVGGVEEREGDVEAQRRKREQGVEEAHEECRGHGGFEI